MTIDAIPITIDTTALDRVVAAIQDARETIVKGFAPALARVARSLATFTERVTATANDPVHVAGVEGRLYVRAAMDPAYATPAALDTLVRDILAGDLLDVLFMRPYNRRLVAAAAMRGWAEHHDVAVPVLAWHRSMAGTRLVVTRSAA